MFEVGQGVKGKITFADGCSPLYVRVYLVVEVSTSEISILNISSTRGKEHKLLFPTNLEIKNYDPPFNEPSFVKLDSLIRVNSSEWGNLKIIRNGSKLSSDELEKINALR